MSIRYIQRPLKIDIEISQNDINRTDQVLLYETTNDPSHGTLIATLKSILTDDNPSIGEAYKFSYTKFVSSPKLYSFYYRAIDLAGNEGEIRGVIELDVCLTPAKPAPIPFDDLIFAVNTSTIADLSANTISQWKMNDDEGETTVIDSQNYYNGTQNETITSVAGKINTAISYNGSSTYFQVDEIFDIQTTDFSLSFWINTSDSSSMIIDAHNTLELVGFYCHIDGGKLKCFVEFDGNDSEVVSTTSVNTSSWIFATITFDRDGDMTLYINNVEEDSTSISLLTLLDLNGEFWHFGVFYDEDLSSFSDYFEGTLDNICVFDKVLSTPERNLLWNSGTGTEDLLNAPEEFQTVFHQNVDTEVITEDGDYEIGDTQIGVATPADGSYVWYRTYSNDSCSTESSDSDNLAVTIDSATPSQIPSSDAFNLSLDNIANGAFRLTWNYNALAADPITGWNIYLDSDGDPSADNFVLDGNVSFTNLTNRFTYITNTNPHDLFVWYKVVTLAGVQEHDNDVVISGTADAEPPVVLTDIIQITLN